LNTADISLENSGSCLSYSFGTGSTKVKNRGAGKFLNGQAETQARLHRSVMKAFRTFCRGPVSLTPPSSQDSEHGGVFLFRPPARFAFLGQAFQPSLNAVTLL
jgi:hypothetical protein